MPGLDDAYDAAAEYLALCQQALATTPAGALGRAYVSPGVPVWDCDQVTVHVGGPVIADTQPTSPAMAPGLRITYVDVLNVVNLTATVLRCIPILDEEGAPPPAAELDAAARVVDADLWAIWNHLRHYKATGALFPPTQRELFIDAAASIAAGGVGGWQIPIRVTLYGYDPEA